MTITSWWSRNQPYAKAWAVHTLVLVTLAYIGRWALWFLASETARHSQSYSVRFAIGIIVLFAIVSFFLYRIVVYSFIYRREGPLLPTHAHPYGAYLMGWSIYYLLSFGVSIIFGFLVAISPIVSYLATLFATFFLFRMVTTKYTHPPSGPLPE